MKVFIGKYLNWWGPYQVIRLLEYLGFSREFCDNLGDKLPTGPFQWFNDLFDRKIKIKIHHYDTWSMDHTLALIIHPMLVQLQATKHGSPVVDEEDVPENLRKSAAPPVENTWDTDDNFHKRWDWVLNEMIWAFEQIADNDKDMEVWENSRDEYENYRKRIENGTLLFGKYYQGLWD